MLARRKDEAMTTTAEITPILRLIYRLPWVKLRVGNNRPVWAARWRDKWFERFDTHYSCGLICFYTNTRRCRRG